MGTALLGASGSRSFIRRSQSCVGWSCSHMLASGFHHVDLFLGLPECFQTRQPDSPRMCGPGENKAEATRSFMTSPQKSHNIIPAVLNGNQISPIQGGAVKVMDPKRWGPLGAILENEYPTTSFLSSAPAPPIICTLDHLISSCRSLTLFNLFFSFVLHFG